MRPRFPHPPRFPVMLIAHRGIAARYPENTIPSLEAAAEAGADVIEFDVQLSRDGALVCVHDETLERTTNGRGRVRDRSLAEIKTLDAGSWFGREFEGLRVPTLDETLDAVGKKAVLNIELKAYDGPDPALADRTYEAVAARGLTETVMFSSFHFDLLARLRTFDPDMPIAALFHFARNRRPVDETVALGARFMGCHHRLVNARRMQEAKKAGVLVCPYTVDTARRADALIDLGVAALITNNVPALQQHLETRSSRR
jgi:glycerophosphoryl diester phosphodiesterase